MFLVDEKSFVAQKQNHGKEVVMPAAFNRCVANGGKVRTKDLGGGRYQYICIFKGEVYPGEVHRKSKKRKQKK